MEIQAIEEPAGQAGGTMEQRPLFRVNSIAPMVAPVTTRRRVRTSGLPQDLRPFVSSPTLGRPSSSVYAMSHSCSAGEEEEKFPLPDNADIWARYGFIEESYLPARAAGEGNEKLSRSPELGEGEAGAASSQALSIIRSDPGGGWRRARADEGLALLRQLNQRDCPAVPAQGLIEPPASASAVAPRNGASNSEGGRPRPVSGPLSPGLGTSTPATVVLTPNSQERCGQETGATAGGVSTSQASHIARSAAVGVSSARGSMEAAAAAAAARRLLEASPASTNGSGEGGQMEETKEEEEEARALQEEGVHYMGWARDVAAQAVGADGVTQQLGGNLTSASSGNDSRNVARRRPPRTMAEVERHKRNRAERLRAYGCQRTLYPRIVPGTSSAGPGAHSVTEEMETVEWVETLRVSASLRGESLMAACTQSFAQSFAQDRAATLLVEKQSEARGSRTADVSEMEGPDGLLHCAVLKGDHALAARAAQFLVDKRGASVNSRDDWGRTPLHTAAGKGMVAMARFFVRRGADVDALDQDDRTPLFFACAGGNTTMARFLTRIEIGARVDLRDNRGYLAGEFFWDSVGQEDRDEIIAILMDAGWPDPPPPRDGSGRLRSGAFRGPRSRSTPASKRRDGRGPHDRAKRQSEGGEAGMKRLASEMKMLMKRR